MPWNIYKLLITTALFLFSTDGKVKIFGPGLSRFFETPTRYFYLSIEEGGRNLTGADFQKGDLKVWISPSGSDGQSNSRIRAAADVFYHSDFAAIIRYRLHETANHGIDVHVTRRDRLRGDEEIEGSPFQIRGPLYHDECQCPFSDFVKFYKALKCPTPISIENKFYTQLFKDLSPFVANGIDMKAIVKETVERFAKSRYQHSFCHYAVVNNKIFRKCYGEHVGFNMFSDNILLTLARRVKLPDMELISNLGDWPLADKDKLPLLPLISWCGSSTTADIILPTYDLTEATLHMLSRVSLDMLSVRGNTGPQWEEKISKAFWRGRDSRQERLDLVAFSKKHPELLDANLTHVFFFREKLAELEPLAKSISFFEFFKFKYQINIDGTVAAYRLPYLLAGDSLVLKTDSNYYEHFYSQLEPWHHFVPIKSDLSDLEKQLKWAIEHDDEARKIAKNAQLFAWDNLLPHHILCYHVALLENYAKLLKSKTDEATLKDMEPVEQPNSSCQCLRGSDLKQRSDL